MASSATARLNSLAGDLEQLGNAYREAADAESSRSAPRGEGRAFCASCDISQVDAANDDAMAFLRDIVTPVLRTIAAFPAPTFAAVR